MIVQSQLNAVVKIEQDGKKIIGITDMNQFPGPPEGSNGVTTGFYLDGYTLIGTGTELDPIKWVLNTYNSQGLGGFGYVAYGGIRINWDQAGGVWIDGTTLVPVDNNGEVIIFVSSGALSPVGATRIYQDQNNDVINFDLFGLGYGLGYGGSTVRAVDLGEGTLMYAVFAPPNT